MEMKSATQQQEQYLQLQQQIVQEEEEEEEEEQQHFHVLAVDDSLIDRKLLERLLKVSSYQVTCVDSVNKALEYLGLLDNLGTASSAAASSSSHSPTQEGMKVNLIMTDYCMPGMSGYDLLKRVKGSSWKDVPVVIMSSENIPSRISMCLEGGAKEFLLKPLQLSDMEKLQPHLLKSLDHSYQTNDKLDHDHDHDNNNNNHDTNKNNSNNISKRKAISPHSSDRRPKLKGLAVA